ncbi:alpha-amylase family glycosyl hydrolase [Alteromonas facilis]|uniref:alpha-amylase family glycosyl hydrolase n=1 Tax=Alteromonas facilis TaxID=2048004 RepID=UPI001F0CA34F|nr:alpha-amylase family glycosyl hydrolase [Alteromonas facilis]
MKPIFPIAFALCSFTSAATQAPDTFIGTQEPFAQEAVYFALTDRFVDGDPTNNHENQGKDMYEGKWFSFNRPLKGPDGQEANVGYLGGDLQGVLNNADYIKAMGFTSIWLTPIWDNPDQAFSGGETITYAGGYKDGGKTGYHGYWAHNFYQADEHLVSDNLSFADFTQQLKQKGLKFVLDIVANHGSPSYSMPTDQPQFGELYDAKGNVVADHQNLSPEDLSDDNPLHEFYNRKPGLAQLSDINENSDAAYDYLLGAYRFWLKQGVDAIRIDTIKEMPHHFWQRVSKDIRKDYPGMFMFGESYSYDANFIAEHTYPQNGGVSVLDFPGRLAITGVFESAESDYADILSYLHLDSGVYQNPYELMTFYDNHDMARMNATDAGFINANNWLFTSRGIPVIYYGSEINFMTGKPEHEGNRNYFGQANVDIAKTHPIQQNLTRIANLRKATPALQRGLQLNLTFSGNVASFYRVLQHESTTQTALVVLNKGEQATHVTFDSLLNQGDWQDAFSGDSVTVVEGQPLTVDVPENGVRVLLFNQPLSNPELLQKLRALQQAALRS